MAKTKSKKEKVRHEDVDPELELDEIKKLGGEKKDLEIIATIEDTSEAIEYEEDLEAGPIKKDEVRDFIKGLGFNEIMDFTEEDGTPLTVKLLERRLTEEEKEEIKKDKIQKQKKEDSLKQEIVKKKNKNKYKVQDEQVSSTTEVDNLGFIEVFLPRKHLLIKPGTKWYDHQFSSDPVSAGNIPEAKLTKIQSYVTKVYENEVALYKKQQDSSKKSDVTWIRTVLATGTVSDKLAAMTLLIHEAPIQNLGCLEQMVNMVRKKGRREALMALDTLKELFLSELLLDEKKLLKFDQHPLSRVEGLASGNKDSRDKRLLVWYYEAQLREKYSDFVQGLEMLCRDNIPAAKQKSLSVIFDLLTSKPEQEKKLLTILTNKLGDPDYKIASRAAYLLTKLVERHPNMKNVVVAEVERLMYRPNIANKAQYYAVCFLNQIVLGRRETELAVRLINIYFSFFKSFVKKGEVDGKMLSALLTGVNRAYPYAKVDQDKISEQMDTLYKIVHIVNFNTSIQALMLLNQVMDSSENTSDRYYQALYKKMMDPELITSAKQAMFLNLLFKSMKKDTVDRRVKTFIKRLLQVCSCLTPPFICGALVLLSEILKSRPGVFQFSQLPQSFDDSDDDDEDEHFHDIKTEDDENEEANSSLNDTSLPDDTEISAEEKQQIDLRTALSHKGHVTVASWVHRKNIRDNSTSSSYDPHHRNPLYAHSESECVWELTKLTAHFHPSVALFARNILKGQPVEYSGDPLADFTLIRFLDRFVFRNPKKKEKTKKETSSSTKDHFRSKLHGHIGKGVKSLAINSEEYLQTDEDKIPVDEKFFYKYFARQAKKKAVKEEVDSDINDDEFDDFLDTYEKGMDGSDFNLDFASEYSKETSKRSEKKTEDASSDDEDGAEDGEDDLDELSDEEVDFSEDDEMKEAFEEGAEEDAIDEEAYNFSDDGGMFEDELGKPSLPKKKVMKRKTSQPEDYEEDDIFLEGERPSLKKGKKSKNLDSGNLFAAAEEFSNMMDENTGSKVNTIGTEAMSNKDNADVKQLAWESQRDRWMKGQDWKTKKRSQNRGTKGTGRQFKAAKAKPRMGGKQKQKKGRK